MMVVTGNIGGVEEVWYPSIKFIYVLIFFFQLKNYHISPKRASKGAQT